MFEKLVESSRNPNKVSLTVSSTLLQVAAMITAFGVNAVASLDPNVITQIAENVGEIVAGIMSLVSLVGVTWGLIRKAFPRS